MSQETRQTSASDRLRPGRWGRLMFGAVLATWLPSVFVAVAHAEQAAGLPEAPSPWLQWLLAFAFGGLCCGIAFKNPKRSHLD